MLGRQQSAPHQGIWDAGGDVLGVPEPGAETQRCCRSDADQRGLAAVPGRVPGPGERAEGRRVLRWRGDVPAGTRGQRAPPGRAAGARPAGSGGLGRATRCHPRQVTASPLPGSWRLRPSCLRGQLCACPRAERSHRERLHPGPPRPRRDARSAAGTAWPKVTQVGGTGGTPACPCRQQPDRAARPSRCPRFSPASFPLQTLHLPPVCPPCPCQMSPSAAGGPLTAACAMASSAWQAGSSQGRARAAGFGGTEPLSPIPKSRAPRLLGLPSRGSFPTSAAAAVPWCPEPWGAGGAHTCADTLPLPASLRVPTFPGFSRRAGSVPHPGGG